MQLSVVVNTVEAGTLCFLTEDVLQPDEQKDGGGGGVDTAGHGRVHRAEPGQGGHETQLENVSGGGRAAKTNSPWWRRRAGSARCPAWQPRTRGGPPV